MAPRRVRVKVAAGEVPGMMVTVRAVTGEVPGVMVTVQSPQPVWFHRIMVLHGYRGGVWHADRIGRPGG